MALLSFSNKYLVSDATAKTTNSASLVDDTVTQTFNLSVPQTVLVFYQPYTTAGVGGDVGLINAIKVDGADHSIIINTAYGPTYGNRNSCVFLGQLQAGQHTITGRLASGAAGTNVRINNRNLLIYILDGDEFTFLESYSAQTINSNAYINDNYTQALITPSGDCKALILYGVSNGAETEVATGKKICINVAGTDYIVSEARQSPPYAANKPESVLTAHALALTGGVQTAIGGRIANNSGTTTVTASKHFLAVLLFAPSVILDVVNSTSAVSTKSGTFVNDTPAIITRNTNGEVLVIASASKTTSAADSYDGLKYGLNIDSVDVVSSVALQCVGSTSPYSAFVAYANTESAGLIL